MSVNTMTDIIKLFAQFPNREGVLKNIRNKQSKVSGYQELCDELETMSKHSLIPEIEDFCFGVNEEEITKSIRSFKGFYLFVDYGSINSHRDQYNRDQSSMHLALTVAIPANIGYYSMYETAILTDQALGYLMQIRARLMEEQKHVSWLKNIGTTDEISPFVARELSNSIGWTMVFQREFLKP